MRRIVALLAVVLGLGAAATAGVRKPRLDLRVSPRVAFSPVEVLVIAELVGGEETEDFYCPGLEWEWDDGDRSAHEADCAPFQPGMDVERRFTARHAYRAAGEYNIRLTMRRADRSLAIATVRVQVYPGLRGY
jgi:hypothetical protein